MATVFWGSQGIIFTDYLEKRRTITGQYYAVLLGRFEAESMKKTWQRTSLLIRNCHIKAGRITLRIAASSTLFTRVGPMRLLFVKKKKKMAWWKAIHVKRWSHHRNRGLFYGVRQTIFFAWLEKLEYRWTKCIELKGLCWEINLKK